MWVLFGWQDHISELREGDGQSWSKVGMRTDVASPLRPLRGGPHAGQSSSPALWMGRQAKASAAAVGGTVRL